jgi:hypothetical protein
MKKTLGLVITAIGILIIAGGFTFTPPHALNPGDSVNGINASALLVFGGFITFGIGIVLYISSLPYAGEKK